jgi:hypothetical protein
MRSSLVQHPRQRTVAMRPQDARPCCLDAAVLRQLTGHLASLQGHLVAIGRPAEAAALRTDLDLISHLRELVA